MEALGKLVECVNNGNVDIVTRLYICAQVPRPAVVVCCVFLFNQAGAHRLVQTNLLSACRDRDRIAPRSLLWIMACVIPVFELS